MDYFLRSARLGFRTWALADAALALQLWGDARVTRLIGGPFTEAQAQARLVNEIATQDLRGIQYWPIFRLADGAHVGCSGLRPYGEGADVLEIGFHIRFDHWGQGYASESARAVIAFAFRDPGVRALFAGHHPENHGSRRLLEKLGFRHERGEFYAPTGLIHPSYLLTREDLRD